MMSREVNRLETKELASYVDQYFTNSQPNFQWKVVKDSKQEVVEVFFTFKLDVSPDIQLQDSEGKVNEPGVLQFEDAICFYDPELSHVSKDHYLQSFPFSISTGIEKGYIEAVCKHLNIVVTQGSAALREFVKDPTQKQFELSWNSVNFSGTIQTLKNTGRYSTDLLQMNVERDQKFIEKLKGSNDDDHVERI